MDEQGVRDLEAHGTRFVRVVWCDNAGLRRAKALHVRALAAHLTHGVGISAGQQAVPALYDAVVPGAGLGPVGEVRIAPDWPTLTPLPYAPGHARVLGDMVLGGKPWPLCPRDVLRRVTADAGRAGFEVRAAFESEFYLVRPTPAGPAPGDDTLFAATLGMDLARPVIDELADALLFQGVPVELYHPESGPGQHELTVGPAPPLQAADRQVVFRETAHAVALRHSLRASFLPKLFAEHAGSGSHLHLSLWSDGRNLLPEARGRSGLSDVARAFCAGVLEHLPALMAVTTPSPNSYRRLKPHCWSGAFRCWGVDNREAALRVPSAPDGGGATNVELKTVDGSANPYLALGAALAAGLDGVRRGLDLPEPVQVDPGTLPEAERRRLGIDPLPASLDESVRRLEADAVLTAALGPELARAFLAVRRAEAEVLRGRELAEEVRLLWERY